MGISTLEQLSLSLSLSVGVVPGPSAAWPVDYCLLMFQSAVCWGMWSYLTWTSPGVPRRRSVWAPPPSPALGTKLSHKHNHTLATPGLQLCASHRREMGKTLHQGDRINLITNRLAKACLTPAVPERDVNAADLHDNTLKHRVWIGGCFFFIEWNVFHTDFIFSTSKPACVDLFSLWCVTGRIFNPLERKEGKKRSYLSRLWWFYLISCFNLKLCHHSSGSLDSTI